MDRRTISNAFHFVCRTVSLPPRRGDIVGTTWYPPRDHTLRAKYSIRHLSSEVVGSFDICNSVIPRKLERDQCYIVQAFALHLLPTISWRVKIINALLLKFAKAILPDPICPIKKNFQKVIVEPKREAWQAFPEYSRRRLLSPLLVIALHGAIRRTIVASKMQDGRCLCTQAAVCTALSHASWNEMAPAEFKGGTKSQAKGGFCPVPTILSNPQKSPTAFFSL